MDAVLLNQHIEQLSNLIDKGMDAYNNSNYDDAMYEFFSCEKILIKIAHILKKKEFQLQSKAINPVDLTYCYPKRVIRFQKAVKAFKEQIEQLVELRTGKIMNILSSEGTIQIPKIEIKKISTVFGKYASVFISEWLQKKDINDPALFIKEDVDKLLLMLLNLVRILNYIKKL